VFIGGKLWFDDSYNMYDMSDNLVMVLFSLYLFKDAPNWKFCMFIMPVLLLVVSMWFMINYFVVDVANEAGVYLIRGQE